VQRATDYTVLREFAPPATLSGGADADAAAAAVVAEDAAEAAGWAGGDAVFGSFARLASSPEWRFKAGAKGRRRAAAAGAGAGGGARRGYCSSGSGSGGGTDGAGGTGGAATAVGRQRRVGAAVTYSPSYTVVPTFECFNSCAYCNFKAKRGSKRAEWLRPGQVSPTRSARIARLGPAF
jgi:hypothetical protein